MIPVLLLALLGGSPQTTSCAPTITLPQALALTLVTRDALSTRTAVKGDIVPMYTRDDLVVDHRILIPKGTEAVGQVAEARRTGGLGVDGRLTLRPLYVKVGDRTVRLVGVASKDGGVSAGAVAGMVTLSPVFSGRSAAIPAGSLVPAAIDRSVDLPTATIGC